MTTPSNEPRIVAAAIKRDGVVFTGIRHGHIVQQMVDVGYLTDMTNPVLEKEQGFIDSNNHYWSRPNARRVAIVSGQIKPTHGTLYSEDLW